MVGSSLGSEDRDAYWGCNERAHQVDYISGLGADTHVGVRYTAIDTGPIHRLRPPVAKLPHLEILKTHVWPHLQKIARCESGTQLPGTWNMCLVDIPPASMSFDGVELEESAEFSTQLAQIGQFESGMLLECVLVPRFSPRIRLTSGFLLKGKLLFTLKDHAHWVTTLTLNTDFVLRTGPYDFTGKEPKSDGEGELCCSS
jgi:hypothetical protein